MNKNQKTEIFDAPDELDRLHLKVKEISKGNLFGYLAIMTLALVVNGVGYIVNSVVSWVKELWKKSF